MKRSLVICSLAVIISFATTAYADSKQQPQNSKTQKADDRITGKILETMDSGGYTYALVETSGGKQWIAVPRTSLKKGQNASFYPGAVMDNFESKTLKRKFEKIIFSAGVVQEQKPNDTEALEQSPGSKGNVVVTAEKIKVEKASGPDARTVEEVFSKKAELNQKKVVIRAKVVKVSQGIMNRNWVHIQDGTGDAKKGTGDLVVTSSASDVPSVGDVVTVNGIVAKDKDFGAGYNYSVIVENGSFKK